MIHISDILFRLVILTAMSACTVTLAQEIPAVDAAPVTPPQGILVVDSDGNILIGGSKAGNEEVTSYARELSESITNPRVQIRCDRSISTKRIKAIVTILADAGVTNLSFVSTGTLPPKQQDPGPKSPPPVVKLNIPADSTIAARGIIGASAILARGGKVEITYPSGQESQVTLYDSDPLREGDPVFVKLTAAGFIFNDELVTAEALKEKLDQYYETATLLDSSASVWFTADEHALASKLYEFFDIVLATGIHAHPVNIFEASRATRTKR